MILAIVFAASLLFSWSQQGAAQLLSKATISTQSVAPTKGRIDKDTYKNPSIGLEFTPAADLKFQEPEMKGTPGTTSLVITVRAAGDRGQSIFYADALASYPEEQRSVSRYAGKIMHANEADGWRYIGVTSSQIAETWFSRYDFAKGDVREAVLVTVHNGYAFVFIFASLDIGVTNELIASTKVKFTP